MRPSVLRIFLPAAAVAVTLCGCHREKPAARPAPGVTPGPVATATTDPEVLAALQDHPIIKLAVSPAESGSIPVRRKRLYYVRGGTLTTVRSASRDMVSDMITRVGGVGGLNGTFFSDARVAGRGNKMIGPLLTGASHEYAPVDPSDAPRCVGRPLVILDGAQIAIVPYAMWMGDSEDALRRVLPGVTDAFLAGGWLVHNGEPETEESIRANCVADAMDFRRRAFVGIDTADRIVLGATDYSIDSRRLATALKKLDIREAVLLDSGFSTSLVWRDRILVSGHSRRDMPSRPVPHALIVIDSGVRGNPS
ncbi:MAG TPA: phosphodiester glycosidase family protein [Armatimonadota bacterium]